MFQSCDLNNLLVTDFILNIRWCIHSTDDAFHDSSCGQRRIILPFTRWRTIFVVGDTWKIVFFEYWLSIQLWHIVTHPTPRLSDKIHRSFIHSPFTNMKLSLQFPIILSKTELISTSVASRPYFRAKSIRDVSDRTRSLPDPIGPKCKRFDNGPSVVSSLEIGWATSMTSRLPIFMYSLSVLAAGLVKSFSVRSWKTIFEKKIRFHWNVRSWVEYLSDRYLKMH